MALLGYFVDFYNTSPGEHQPPVLVRFCIVYPPPPPPSVPPFLFQYMMRYTG